MKNNTEKLGEKLGVKLGVNCELNISETSVQNNIKKLKKLEIIKRIGSDKNGYWKILK
jgi:DNA-binding Lrp family transcriptional regulator